ncbi:hypothetical protein FOCC_FOCC001301 [Frankliniella occidentalis]|nr:hypothetical protein FOCC_FOCC001301 [Frankliniella occidentalis]
MASSEKSYGEVLLGGGGVDSGRVPGALRIVESVSFRGVDGALECSSQCPWTRRCYRVQYRMFESGPSDVLTYVVHCLVIYPFLYPVQVSTASSSTLSSTLSTASSTFWSSHSSSLHFLID